MNDLFQHDALLSEFMDAITAPDVQMRRQALLRVLESKRRLEQRFFRPLLDLITHEKDEVLHHWAILALGYVDDPRVFDVLVGLFNHPTTRFAAGRALGVFHSDAAVATLIEALGDADPSWRLAAAEAFAVHGDMRAVDALIAALNDDATPLVQGAAVTALGRMHARAATTPLLGLLADPATHTGAAWIHVLPYLIKALGQIGDPQAVAPLITLLTRESRASYFAAEALGLIGDSRAFEPLLALVQGADRDLAAWAARALGRLGEPRALAPLLEALHDPVDSVRIAAAEGLGYLGDPAAVPALTWAVAHDAGEDPEAGLSVQSAAEEALRRITRPIE